MNRPLRGTVTLLWIIPLVLSCWGVLVILSMTGWSTHGPAAKQLIWLGISFLGFLVVRLVPIDWWERHNVIIFGICLLLIAATLTPLGVTVKGASRWLHFGLFNFQPAEAMGVALPFLLEPMYRKSPYPWRAALVTAIVIGIVGILLLIQPDFGSLLLLVGLTGALFVDHYGFFVPLVALLPIVPILLFVATRGYRMDRIAMWVNPWLDPMGAGYQVIQGLIAFANGGLWGIGIHRSQDFLPEVHNDFIFPALGEQFGLFGSLFTLLAFTLLVLLALRAYRRVTGPRRALIWALCVAIILPLFINVGGVTKLIPLSGMPLPFISYGGTSLLFTWVKIGLLCRLIDENGELEGRRSR